MTFVLANWIEKCYFWECTALPNRNVPFAEPSLFVQARVREMERSGKVIAGRCSVSHVDFIVFLRIIYLVVCLPLKTQRARNRRTSKCTLAFFDSAELDYYLFNIAWKWYNSPLKVTWKNTICFWQKTPFQSFRGKSSGYHRKT